ncbi:recombination protein NinG [Noviherbaspirillum suwonense]|uniref:Bacteriophage Lambda NinG protein n=1 Tax=Noviherbaspirillum suwonense TaxID=1224511 RepID=A0ABY1QL72_9BURK|nr:recombination protein NinG [Noviherbaspirillum suwonense]SMP71819.1 Bacteriophage Lambda NinG protein [Noviherbaspirillum suwonense]
MIRSAQSIKPKFRRCKECGQQYEKRTMAHIYCSPPCLFEAKAKADEKKAKADYQRRKEAIKTRSDHMKAAQVEFNKFVRTRDAGKSCICCPAPLQSAAVGGGFDCGHYRSVGSAPHLRFDERNAHGQTKQCNRYGAGRAVDYRLGLIARIGLAEVEALEAEQGGGKWTVDELVAIKLKYRAKTKALLAQQKESQC